MCEATTYKRFEVPARDQLERVLRLVGSTYLHLVEM